MTTILYVDDDPDNLVVFEALCAGHFDTVTAASGVRALEILDTREIAVLLADQRMPEMTGVELAERAAREHPDVVRILITAYSDLSEAIDAINRGQVRGYLRKPWDSGELFATLREALTTYATRQRVRQLERHMLATERVYAIGAITAGIAHEVRSPLQALADGIDVVRSQLETASAHARNGEGVRAAEIIDSLRPFMEAQATSTAALREICRGFEVSNYEVDPSEHCNLDEVAQTAARLVLASNDGTRELQVESDGVFEVWGNRHRLGRVLINLLMNAFESVTELDEPEVLLRLHRGTDADEGFVIVDVLDNGPGVPAQFRERIFDAFFSTKESTGTGLGLSMSRRIAEEVGGTLCCYTPERGGAHFRLRLRAW